MRLAVAETELDGHRFFTGFLQELSEQKEAEAALRETQAQLYHAARHGEIGEMASAIAHELNQPLTAILNYVQAVRDAVAHASDLPPKTGDFLERAGAQAERAGLIIRRLRQLYERGEAEIIPDDLNAAVQEALDIALIGTGERDIDVDVDLDSSLPAVYIDRQQIQQVVINLVRNAVEALADTEERSLSVTTGRNADGIVKLAIADSGPGMPPEVAENLFSPFQTTKAAGMGLGLSICHSIVESHGGNIAAIPNPEGGTIFRVSLTSGSVEA